MSIPTHALCEPKTSQITPLPAGNGASARDRAPNIAQELSRRIGPHKYDMWFAHASLRVEDGSLQVQTDSQFVANWIDSHFSGELRGLAADILGPAAQIKVSVAHGAEVLEPQNGAAVNGTGRHAALAPAVESVNGHGRNGASRRHADKSSNLRRLADFVVGPSNKLAFAAATRLADDPDARCISPVFIHGDCGVGKTHLLQGVCQRYAETSGRSQHVRYVTGEQFTNEYITAIRTNSIDAFRQKIRRLDLLAIDDVHFLSNKVRTQTEFLYTLDAIDLSGARVVLASDNHPHHIQRFSQALVSRFLSGMVVKVDRPDRATRIELIHRLAGARGLRINSAAVEMIAGNCVGSVRELEGAITKLAAYKSLLEGQRSETSSQRSEATACLDADPCSPTSAPDEIGVVLAEQLFRDRAWQPAQAVRLGTIVDSVCSRLAVSKAEVLGSGRHRRMVLARGMVAYFGRELTTHSFPEIAQALGRANHSTIHTADQRLRRQIAQDEMLDWGGGEPRISLRELVDQLRRTILESKP